jgi:hypothetical protein
MPLNLPNLDDRRYEDLVDEARAMIPGLAPEWTDHNPSDPGITLIELFAYLTEMLIFRLNRITDENIRTYLKLLDPDWKPSGSTREALEQDVLRTVVKVRKRVRAVTCMDFEELALEADSRVARSRCLARRNALVNFETEQEGYVSVIVVPGREHEEDLEAIVTAVKADLDPRRLLTTQVRVTGPQYLPLTIKASVVPLSDERLPTEGDAQNNIATRVVEAVKTFLDPLGGGGDGKGWPFGRNVFVSEINQLIDGLRGIDYVRDVTLTPDDPERVIEGSVGVNVKPYELVDARMTTVDVTVERKPRTFP